MADAILVTVSDPATGEVLETRALDNDFMILCAGNRFVKGVQAYGNGTQVVTVAVDRQPQVSEPVGGEL